MDKIAFLSDLHIPHHDGIMLEETINILKVEQPNCIVLGGDILDFPNLSKYLQEPNFEKVSTKEAIELCADFLEQLRRTFPNARIDFVEGNHEFRLRSYPIRLAPEMFDFIDLPRELQLGILNINFSSVRGGATKFCDTYTDIDGIKLGHFDKVNQGSGNTVKNIMRQRGNGNYVQGHTHRAGIVWFTDIDKKKYFGVENPCLCKSPHYTSATDWQFGFTIIDKTEYGYLPRQILF